MDSYDFSVCLVAGRVGKGLNGQLWFFNAPSC